MVSPRADPVSRRGDRIELRIPSSAAYVGIARRTVENVARQLPFEHTEVEDIKLAVGEACNNAIKYGAEANGRFPVTIRCIVRPRALQVEVRNYHPADEPRPTIDNTPDITKEGGLGFCLMRQLVDQMDFVWGERFALVRLVKIFR